MEILSMNYGQHCVPEWTWSVMPGCHQGFTIWSVWSGGGRMTIGDITYPLCAGDIFFINYQSPVNAYQDNESNLYVRYIDFCSEDNEYLSILPTYRHIEDHRFLSELFDRFCHAQERHNPPEMKIWLCAILSEYQNETKAVHIAPYTDKIEKLCHTLRQNPGVQHSIESLAEGLSVTPDHFIRLFKQEKGVTPYAYIQQIRLETAKMLLRMSDLTVTNIASACGFSNIYNFSRFFREKTGCSPSEFRVSVRE